MLSRGRLLLLAALGTLATGRGAGAQSVLDRTPNLAGGWVGVSGVLHFNFLHRFSISSAPEAEGHQHTHVPPCRRPPRPHAARRALRHQLRAVSPLSQRVGVLRPRRALHSGARRAGGRVRPGGLQPRRGGTGCGGGGGAATGAGSDPGRTAGAGRSRSRWRDRCGAGIRGRCSG